MGFGGGDADLALSRLSLRVCEQDGEARGALRRVSRDFPINQSGAGGALVLCGGWMVQNLPSPDFTECRGVSPCHGRELRLQVQGGKRAKLGVHFSAHQCRPELENGSN